MFNLPKSTEIRKNIFKKTIYDTFPDELSGKKKGNFDKEISKITITNEISEQSVNIPKAEDITAIFVVKIDLKKKEYQDSNIILISKLFGQNLLLALNYEGEYRLAIYENKLLVGDWKKEEDISLKIQGLNLKKVWENLVTQVADIEIEKSNTLEEQIKIEDEKERLEKLIARTEKKAKKELQAKKKLELFKEIKEYKKKLEEL